MPSTIKRESVAALFESDANLENNFTNKVSKNKFGCVVDENIYMD